MKDTSTRSGLLWEVERILSELDEKPQILLMENVVDVHNERNKEDFQKWIIRLEQLGYKNYYKDLIATDYGIPQTRNRCFMVSVLGDYSYSFPMKQPLTLKLKDLLEDKVDEKFYLSDRMKKYIFSGNDKYKVSKNSLKINREIACTKTCKEGTTRADTSDYIGIIDSYNKRMTENVGTITTGQGRNQGSMLIEKSIKIKNNTSKGYIEAHKGDGIDLQQPNSKTRRGRVQNQTIQMLDTYGGITKGVVVDE